jgi:hypothetical protein
MSRPLELELLDIETACTAIEAAVISEDWPAAGQGNAELNARLSCLSTLLDETGSVPTRSSASAAGGTSGSTPAGTSGSTSAGTSLALIATRLERVLAKHAQLADCLIARREETAAGLATLRTGRRGATHYLETAEY